MPTLGQVEAKPLLCDTWAQAKALVLQVLAKSKIQPYGVYTEPVRQFHLSDARIRIPSAPARTSKSISTAADSMVYTLPTEPETDALIWMIGPSYAICKEFDYMFDWLVTEKILESKGLSVIRARNSPSNGDMEIVIERRQPGQRKTRCTILGMSSTNERALQGEEVTVATLSEAAEHPAHIFDKYLATRCWKINCPTTPKAYAEWLYDLVKQGDADPTLSIENFEFPPDSNPLYNWERYEQAKKRASIATGGKPESDPWFAEQFLGKWGVFYTGRVLPFDDNRNLIEASQMDLGGARLVLSLDYGYEDAAVCLFWAILPNGLYVLFDEIYETHLSTQAFTDKVRVVLSHIELPLEYVVGDPSRPEVARVFREAGLPVWDRDKNAMRDRAAGTRRLQDALLQGPLEGFPALYVTTHCQSTLREWKYLRFRDGMKNEYATGYFIQTRPLPHIEKLDDEGAWLKRKKKRITRRFPRWARRLDQAERRIAG